jgi:hypothetical protein
MESHRLWTMVRVWDYHLCNQTATLCMSTTKMTCQATKRTGLCCTSFQCELPNNLPIVADGSSTTDCSLRGLLPLSPKSAAGYQTRPKSRSTTNQKLWITKLVRYRTSDRIRKRVGGYLAYQKYHYLCKTTLYCQKIIFSLCLPIFISNFGFTNMNSFSNTETILSNLWFFEQFFENHDQYFKIMNNFRKLWINFRYSSTTFKFLNIFLKYEPYFKIHEEKNQIHELIF